MISDKIYCERCNLPTTRLKMIGIYDVQSKKKKLMWLCPDCYNEHTWEESDDRDKPTITPAEGTGKG